MTLHPPLSTKAESDFNSYWVFWIHWDTLTIRSVLVWAVWTLPLFLPYSLPWLEAQARGHELLRLCVRRGRKDLSILCCPLRCKTHMDTNVKKYTALFLEGRRFCHSFPATHWLSQKLKYVSKNKDKKTEYVSILPLTLLNLCVHVRSCVWTYACGYKYLWNPAEGIGSLGAGLSEDDGLLLRLLGTEHESPERAVHTLSEPSS